MWPLMDQYICPLLVQYKCPLVGQYNFDGSVYMIHGRGCVSFNTVNHTFIRWRCYEVPVRTSSGISQITISTLFITQITTVRGTHRNEDKVAVEPPPTWRSIIYNLLLFWSKVSSPKSPGSLEVSLVGWWETRDIDLSHYRILHSSLTHQSWSRDDWQ